MAIGDHVEKKESGRSSDPNVKWIGAKYTKEDAQDALVIEAFNALHKKFGGNAKWLLAEVIMEVAIQNKVVDEQEATVEVEED